MTFRGGNLVGCLTESFGGRSLVLRFGFGMIVRGAVLAGGESQRMGRDKAFLRHPRGGRPLWERQVDVVAGLGVEEVFVSIGTGTEWEMVLEGARGDLRFLRDEDDGKGPLEGIYRVMGARPDSWWVLLAVDLPAMRTETLQKRLHLAEEKGQAVIPWYRGYWEPVAGVWAPSIYPLVRKAREEGRLGLQGLLTEAEAEGLVLRSPVEAEEEEDFRNVNTREEWAAFARGVGP